MHSKHSSHKNCTNKQKASFDSDTNNPASDNQDVTHSYVNPHEPSEDPGLFYAEASLSSRKISSLYAPPPITEEAGEKGIMDDIPLESEYEVMLTTARNPAYKNVHSSTQITPQAQIYETLPN